MNTKRGMLFTLLLVGSSNLFGADAGSHRGSPTDAMLRVDLSSRPARTAQFGSDASNVAARALQERLRTVVNERDNAKKTIERLTAALAAAEAGRNGIPAAEVEAAFRAVLAGADVL